MELSLAITNFVITHIWLLIFLAVSAISLFRWLRERGWQRRLEEAAKSNGLFFAADEEHGPVGDYAYVSGFSISKFERTSLSRFFPFVRPNIQNIIFKDNAYGLRVFEYRSAARTGKNRRTQTFTCIRGSFKKELPDFFMRQENILDRFTSFIGYSDVDFGRWPEFSKSYFLKSDSQKITQLFNDGLISFFEKERLDLAMEVRGKEIIMYRLGRLAEPEDYIPLMSRCEKIIQKLSDAGEKL